jgi:hypothetical protein
MKYRARAIVTEYYDIDMELDDNIVETFCQWEGITKEEFLANLDEYRYSFGWFLNSEWGFYEVGTYDESDADIYEPEFVEDVLDQTNTEVE